MGSYSIFPWLIIFILVGGIAYFVLRTRQPPESQEQQTARIRSMRSYFESQITLLGEDRLRQMTPTELTDWLNARPDCEHKFHLRSVIAYIQSNKLRTKGMDGTLTYEEQKEERKADRAFGEKKEKIVCPHCQTKGFVRVRRGEKRTSIQTTGLGPLNSVLLPKGESKTEANFLRCDNCEMEWES